jgi:hypothetical protein
MKRFFLALAAMVGIVGLAHAVNITGSDTSGQNQIVSVGYSQISVSNAITAAAGGGQANAVLLTSAYNRVTVVATAADSVKLPPCTANSAPNGASIGVGGQVWVINADASDSMNVFPSTGDNINLAAANAAIAVANTQAKIFTCVVAGTWQSINGT